MFGADLDDALILLPTRRAVRELGVAFVHLGQQAGQGASLLPRMRPLADIDPEEPPFEPGYLTGLVRPAMPSSQRRFELARIIGHYHEAANRERLDPAGMLALTDPLLAILDDAALEEVSLSGLAKLQDIKDFAARHFQNAATVFDIIQDFWPKHVNALGLMEPMERRVALLNALTRLWEKTPPAHPVIIAGSTGTLKASAKLMRCVAAMPGGVIVLPGLDTALTEASWNKIEAEHPQNSLKNLIAAIGVERGDVPVWPVVKDESKVLKARRRITSESLVPVGDTADWPGRIKKLRHDYPSGDIFEDALKGLSVIEARTEDEEALSIALMMRETVDTKDMTAALITPDPALARRVKARLRRWNIDVDYSQGEPLEETRIGSFLTGVLNLAGDPENPVDLAFLCKHSLTGLGLSGGEAAKTWRALERKKYRGPRPEFKETPELLQLIEAALADMTSGEIKRAAPEWAAALTRCAESFAASDALSGAEVLWQGEAGETAASMLEDLMAYGDSLGAMTRREFASLLGSLMRGRVVRPRYGTHPRLQILGPLEARMVHADRIILGSLNEGIWPAGLSAQPFLSRGMRQVLGLSLPERRYGLAAHDFAQLASNPEVIFTRAMRSDSGPRVASRWLWRLQALVKGAMGENSDVLETANPYLEWARALDNVPATDVQVVKPPEPRPHPDERWPVERKLRVTQIRTWVRDPYAIYAQTVLDLEPLEALDESLGPREYGTAIHNGLEAFVKRFTTRLPDDAPKQLAADFEKALLAARFPEAHLIKERVRLAKAAEELTAWFADRRAKGWEYAQAENTGRVTLSEVNFTLSSRADLIEKSALGYAVIDYKTGAPASEKVVQAGFDPQLPLTAIMLARGAFDHVPPGATEQMLYMRVKGAGGGSEPKYITAPENKKGWSAEEYQTEALDMLIKLVTAFDDPKTPYLSQPRVQYTNDYGDYDDLARRGEWAQLGDEGET